MIPPSAWLVDMAVQTSLVVVVALLASWLLRRAAPAVRSALWLVVLVRLCLPVPLALPTGLMPGPGMARPATEVRSVEVVDVAESRSAPEALVALEEPPPMEEHAAPAAVPIVATEPSSPKPLLPQADSKPREARPVPWLSVAWLAGVALLALLAVAQTVVVHRRVRRCRPIEDPRVLALAEELRRLAGVRRRLPIVVAGPDSRIPAPAVLGVLRPVIVLPESVAAWSDHRLGPMLLHELAHVSRGDLLINAVQRWAQVVHFFNPLVWLANRQLRRERELATDDAVVRLLGGRPKPYLETLVAVAEQSVAWRLAPLAVGLAEPTSQLERRIRRMQQSSFLTQLARTPRLAIAATLALGLVLSVVAAQKPVAAKLTGTVACEGQPKSVQATAWSWSDRLFEHPEELMEPLATTKVAPGQAFELELPTDDLPVLVELSAPEHVALRYLVVFEEDRHLQPAYLRLGETRQVTVRDGVSAAEDVLVRGAIKLTAWSSDPHRWEPCVPSTTTDDGGLTKIVVPPVEHTIQLAAIAGEGRWARSDEEREVTTLRLADRTTEVTVVDSRQRPVPGVRVAPVNAPVGAGAISDDTGTVKLWMPATGDWSIAAVSEGLRGAASGDGPRPERLQLELKEIEGPEIRWSAAGPVAASVDALSDALLLSPVILAESVRLPMPSSAWAILWGPQARPLVWRSGSAALKRPAQIVGQVTAPPETPVGGLPVWIHGPEFWRTSQPGMGVGHQPTQRPWLPWAFTDGNGRFRIEHLSAAPVQLEIRSPGLPPALTDVIELEDGKPTEVTIRLVPGGTVRLAIADPDGLPIEGATVLGFVGTASAGRPMLKRFANLASHQQEAAASTFTAVDGTAELGPLPVGPAHLLLEREGFVRRLVDELEVTTGGTDAGRVVMQRGVTLSGITVDGNGDPVSGARVLWIQDAQMPPQFARMGQVMATSDANGRFAIADLDPGESFGVAAEAEGMVPAATVAVELPTEESITVRLEPERALTGTVRDEDRRPVEGATAGLMVRHNNAQGNQLGLQVGSEQTDPNGRFRIAGVGSGSYTLHVVHDDFKQLQQEIVLGADESSPEIEITLEKGHELRVRVLRSDGSPADGAIVSYHGHLTLTTDQNGELVLTGLSKGTLTLRARTEDDETGEATVDVGGTKSITIRLQRPGSLAGRVVQTDGSPVASAEIRLHVSGHSPPRPISAESDIDGRFEIDGIPPGSATVLAAAEGLVSARENVTIEPGKVTQVFLELADGGEISGVVRGLAAADLQTCVILVRGVHASTRPSGDGTFTLSGVPSGRQTVQAQTGFGSGRSRSQAVDVEVGQRAEVELDFSSAHTVTGTVRRGQTPAAGVVMSLTTLAGDGLEGSRTDSDGHYRLEVPEDGSYVVSARSTAFRALASRQVVVDRDLTVDLDLPGGAITGRVVDASDEAPVAGAFVELYSDASGARPEQLTTNSDGRFQLTDLADGNYLLAASHETRRATATVALADRLSREVTLRLEPEQKLTLHLEASAPGALGYVSGRVLVGGAGAPIGWRATCSESRCEISALPAGPVVLLVQAYGPGEGAIVAAEVPGEAAVPLAPFGFVQILPGFADTTPDELWSVQAHQAGTGLPVPLGEADWSGWAPVGPQGTKMALPAGDYRLTARDPSGSTTVHTVQVPPKGTVALTIGSHTKQ